MAFTEYFVKREHTSLLALRQTQQNIAQGFRGRFHRGVLSCRRAIVNQRVPYYKLKKKVVRRQFITFDDVVFRRLTVLPSQMIVCTQEQVAI